MKNPKLSETQKTLLSQVEDELTRQLLTYVCLGQSEELTPLACENLVKAYLEKGK